jgi:hypothetical protein
LLKGIFQLSEGVSRDKKIELLEKILGDDLSDKSIKTKLYCMTSLPELE